MKEIFIVVIMGMLVLSMFSGVISSDKSENVDILLIGDTDELKVVTIKVAVNDANSIVPFGSQNLYYDGINGYSWIVNATSYVLDADMTHTDDIINGNLSKYTVFAHMAMHDEELLCSLHNLKYPGYDYTGNEIKQKLREYIGDGGGFIGHCGGAAFPLGFNKKPETVGEKIYELNSFIDSSYATLNYKAGLPFISEHFYIDGNGNARLCVFPGTEDPDPTRIGADAYMYYSGLDTDNETHHFGGAPLDHQISDHDHPIFKDFLGDSFPILWAGGPAFDIPYDNNDVSCLAYYPSEGISCNDSTSITAWTFPYFWIKLGITWGVNFAEELKNKLLEGTPINLSSFLIATYQMPDWNPTTEPISLDLHDSPAIISFNYPDETGGRIILCGAHPEIEIWDREDKYIRDLENMGNNTLWNGLHQWVTSTDTPPYYRPLVLSDKTGNPNIWFLQRETAYASGIVPDAHLPPAYGKSQVVDIDPLLQESPEFTIECCVVRESGEDWQSTNLSLWYKYNNGDWTYYDSITEVPWTFTFNTDDAMGDGKYEFCSTLDLAFYHDDPPTLVLYEEEFPPGPDAWCMAGDPIAADFSFTPHTPQVHEDITFTSESLSLHGLWYWGWDFGDGNTTEVLYTDEPVVHQYADDGTYTVELLVKDHHFEELSVTKNITVYNSPPIAEFTPQKQVITPGQTASFTDISQDADGEIINWAWDFGDGTFSYNQHPDHTYPARGFHSVSLKVTDDDGMSDTIVNPRCIIIADALVDNSLPNDIPSQHLWNTIQEGITDAPTNGIVYVKEGVYLEDIVIDKSVIVIGEGEESVTLLGSETAISMEGDDAVYLEGFSVKNAAIGIIPCNHTQIYYCDFIDNTIGVQLEADSLDTRIQACTIAGGDIGINIIHSNPDEYNTSRIVDCSIDNVNINGILISNSSNIRIVKCANITSGSTRIRLDNCDYDTITIAYSTSDEDFLPLVTPDIPTGSQSATKGRTYTYSTSMIDPAEDQLLYWFDWGDGTNSGWIGLYDSGETAYANKTWTHTGSYQIKVKAKDIYNCETDWSYPLDVTISSSCLLAGTQVTMIDGTYKSIEDVNVGDIVLSYDIRNKKEIAGVVTKTVHHEPEEMLEYYLIINTDLRVTPNHDIYMNNKWIHAGEVHIADSLSTAKIQVNSIEKVYEQVPTYNLIVQPFNQRTFFDGIVGSLNMGYSHQSHDSMPFFAENFLVHKQSVKQIGDGTI